MHKVTLDGHFSDEVNSQVPLSLYDTASGEGE